MDRPRLIILSILLLAFGCGRESYHRVSPSMTYPPRPGWTQVGMASWYGRGFHGRKTANGEYYNMYRHTAAHKTLPFDTYVKVYNLDNGRSTVVRINDRGPFMKGRIIDLSYAAASDIGMIGSGTARVRLTVLPVSSVVLAPTGAYYVQVGSFIDSGKAYRLRRRLMAHLDSVHVVRKRINGITYYRVRVGPFFSKSSAEDERRWLRERGLPGLVVRE